MRFFWEHVIMRIWRINREGTIAMVVSCESVITISKKLSEREILQSSSLPHTALRKQRYFFPANLRTEANVSLWLRSEWTEFSFVFAPVITRFKALQLSSSEEMKAGILDKCFSEAINVFMWDFISFFMDRSSFFLACVSSEPGCCQNYRQKSIGPG